MKGIPFKKPKHQVGLKQFFENMIQNEDMPSVITTLVDTGKQPDDIMTKSSLDDENEVNDTVLALMDIEELDLPPLYATAIRRRLAGKVSIGGRGRKEVVMAASGVVVADYITEGLTSKNGGNGHKKRRDIPKDDDEKEDE